MRNSHGIETILKCLIRGIKYPQQLSEDDLQVACTTLKPSVKHEGDC